MPDREQVCRYLHELSEIYTTAVKKSLEMGTPPSDEDVRVLKCIKKLMDEIDCAYPYALLKPPKQVEK